MRTYWQRINTIVGPAQRKGFGKIGQKKTRDAIEDFIIKNSNARTLILDAGCNTGVEAHRLLEKGFKGKYLGVDNNEKAIQIAKKNFEGTKNATFRILDVKNLDFKNRYFDIVLTKDVIEHHKNYKPILSELTRVTKRWLILSMFIKPSHLFSDKIYRHSDGYYLNKYNRSKLIEFVTSKGFKKAKVLYQNLKDIVFLFEKKVQ